jgi:hypothetical protein
LSKAASSFDVREDARRTESIRVLIFSSFTQAARMHEERARLIRNADTQRTILGSIVTKKMGHSGFIF